MRPSVTRKKGPKVVFCDFYDFRSDRTPPGPMNLLVITMVWGASACRGAEEGAFSISHEKIIKILNNPPAVIGVGGLHHLLRAAPPPALFPRSLLGKQPTGPPGGGQAAGLVRDHL